MPSAFFTGLSGLRAHARSIEVIANNLANLNTIAFKGSRADFRDLFYQQIGQSRSGVASQVGIGVAPITVSRRNEQGTIQNTGGLLDAAVQGDLSRSRGFRVQRYPIDYEGFAGRDLTPGTPVEQYPNPFDFSGDGEIDESDVVCFSALFTGPCIQPCEAPIFANAAGFFGDGDSDGDIDCDDWSLLEAAWTGKTAPSYGFCHEGFRRGDATVDGTINVTDAVTTLGFLFRRESVLCILALDSNDDDVIDIGDPLYMLFSIFADGPPIPEPRDACGADPTPGSIPCISYVCP